MRFFDWPRGANPTPKQVENSFSVSGYGPYALTDVPDAGIVMAFFDGVRQPLSNFTVNRITKQAYIASTVSLTDSPSGIANFSKFTLRYTAW